MTTIQLNGYAVVTGAGSGIGLTTSISFVRAGVAGIALLDISPENLSRAQAACEAEVQPDSPCNIQTYVMDVSSEESVVSTFSAVMSTFGRIDYAVNAAGVLAEDVIPTANLPGPSFNRVLNINTIGLFYCLREEVKAMQAQSLGTPAEATFKRPASKGSIVNIASIAGLLSMYGALAYTTSKHAVVGMTKSAAIDHAHEGIRVNAICPGWVETPMVTGIRGYSEEMKKRLATHAPMGRVAQTEEVADIILVLCSHLSSFVTGAMWTVDGGLTAGKTGGST